MTCVALALAAARCALSDAYWLRCWAIAGPALEVDLSTLLQVLALGPNLRALLEHLPATTAPAVRSAVERLAQLAYVPWPCSLRV